MSQVLQKAGAKASDCRGVGWATRSRGSSFAMAAPEPACEPQLLDHTPMSLAAEGSSITVVAPEPACEPPLLDIPLPSFAAKGSSVTMIAPEPACEPPLLDHTLHTPSFAT